MAQRLPHWPAMLDPRAAAIRVLIDEYVTRLPGTLEEREAASEFAKAVVRLCGPREKTRAGALLSAASRLAMWAQRIGVELVPKVVLHPDFTERFVNTDLKDLSLPARKTYRANLRHIAAAACPETVPPRPPSLPRSDAAEPYSRHEIDAYLQLASMQPTPRLSARLTAFICATVGAGLEAPDYRETEGRNVVRHPRGTFVHVQGKFARPAWVDPEYAGPLLSVARKWPDHLLIGGDSADRKNITTDLLRDISGGDHLPALTVRRLRATCLMNRVRDMGFPAFCRSLGLKQTSTIWQLVKYLPTPTVEDMNRALSRRLPG